MSLHHYKKVSDSKVEQWIERNLELTPYQRSKMRDKEIVSFAPFEFFERRKKVRNVLVRLTIIGIPFMWIALMLSLPFHFIMTGRWGYSYEKVKWYHTWTNAVGL